MAVTGATKRHYDEPPLEEAIFELFVSPSTPWSPSQAEEHARSSGDVAREVDDLVAWQKRAHVAIVKSFELTVTGQARTLFKERPC
jgi:hypothetical protein